MSPPARTVPFELQVEDAALEDLRQRLERTRLPDQAPGCSWECGTELGWFQSILAYWRTGFDWRAQERRLNAFAQFKAKVGGIDLHFLHVPGEGPRPGSVFEFLELIPRLTQPQRFGAPAEDAFTVVAPSLPGFGLSFEPGQPRFSAEAMADALVELMSGVLGYERFAAQGGDWGASIAARIGLAHPQRVYGIHLNLLPLPRDPARIRTEEPAQARYLAQLRNWLKEDAAYAAIQGTRPQTLAYGLSDSPAGLAAWILEKMRAWSDCGGDVESAIDRDTLLANVSLYWFTGAIGSSFWPYYARAHGPWPVPEDATVGVPLGYAEFPAEILKPPRSLAQRTFTDIRRWTEMPRGGHFAALEQPEALASEIRAFFRPLRHPERTA